MSRRRAVMGVLATLLACAALQGCSGGAEQPAQPRGALRIAVLSPALGLILTDLGLRDRIVARHGYDRFLPRSVPAAGDQAGIDYERLVAVHPTLVLLEWGRRPLPATLRALARARGWRVESFTLLSLEDVRTTTRAIGALTGVEDRAAQAIAAFDAALRVDPTVRDALGRTLILYFVDPIAAAGPASALWQVAAALGARSALPPEARPFVSLDAEDLLALDPDSILIVAPGADADRAREDPLAFAGPIAQLPLRAVQQRKVGVIVHPAALSASLRLREVAMELRAVAQRLAQAEAADASGGA